MLNTVVYFTTTHLTECSFKLISATSILLLLFTVKWSSWHFRRVAAWLSLWHVETFIAGKHEWRGNKWRVANAIDWERANWSSKGVDSLGDDLQFSSKDLWFSQNWHRQSLFLKWIWNICIYRDRSSDVLYSSSSALFFCSCRCWGSTSPNTYQIEDTLARLRTLICSSIKNL